MEWRDLRIVLAVARTGSATAAASHLELAHTTVSRRLAALELAGPALFVRTCAGLVPTPDGDALLERARAVEDAMLGLERGIADLKGRLAGTVRVATALGWSELLMPYFRCLRARAPRLLLHVQVSNKHVDLARREADLAIRGMPSRGEPVSADVVAKKLVSVGYALFGSDRYFERCGAHPGPIADLSGHDVVALTGSLHKQPGADFLSKAGARRERTMSTNHVQGATEAVAAGFGLAVLPCHIGLARGLRQLGAPIDRRDIYIAFAADMQHVPRVRAVVDAILEGVRANAERLQGQSPRP
jgi:DNA-binding transcriptional LysR family regulator